MPNKDDIPALARWLNESASDLIQYVMTRHTGNLLYGQIKNMERDYASLLKSYDELRKKYLEATGKPDLYPYGQQ